MAEAKGGLAFIPEDNPAAIQANKAYQDALDRLNKALESRQNRMFDPTMLALAEGFLTPGRTGSFGESLGVAAGKMRAAEEAEGKTEQEIAQAKLGLAERGIAMQQQIARDQPWIEAQKAAARPSGGAPSVGGAAEQPTAERPSVAQPDALAAGAQIAQQSGAVEIGQRIPISNPLPDRATFMADKRRKGFTLSDAEDAWRKVIADSIKVTDNYILDTANGIIYQKSPEVEMVKIPFATQGGSSYLMTKTDAQKLQNLRNTDPAKALEFERQYVTLPGGGARPTAAQSEARSAAEVKRAEADVAQEAEEKTQFRSLASSAREQLPIISQISQIAATPGMEKFIGRFAGGDAFSALIRQADSGIGTQNFRVALQNFQRNLQGIGATPNEIALGNLFAMNAAKIQFAFSQAAKGQGSISDRERNLFETMGISLTGDPVQAVQLKAAAIAAKSEFDKKAYDLFRATGETSVSEFKRTNKEFQNLENQYVDQLTRMVSSLQPSQQPSPAAPSGAQPSSSLDRRRDELRRRLEGGQQ
jgi:predicted negative regulator of RcsB-dependent stress response